LIVRSARLGKFLLAGLAALSSRVVKLRCVARGLGLLAGLELRNRNGRPATQSTIRLMKALLQRGYIFLPEGEHGNVLGFTPPLIISKAQLESAIQACAEVLQNDS
jgi:4-aminobutyrate aminotransferase-like enzyme